jgi:uncharacterized protein (DUF4213/DUF364 family)
MKPPRSEPTMQAIYDRLIAEIPEDPVADETVRGEHWTMVRSGAGIGLAMTVKAETRPRTLPESCAGMPLRELAGAVKSWNFADASLGMAAINAFHNSPDRPWIAQALARGGGGGAFEIWRSRAAGKKVAIIGHFYHVERTLGEVCELSILEQQPGPGDYPDSACEYLLPRQDFVFATGVTFINKTFPRILELSQKSGLILAGPSVPMAPLLFNYGVLDLQGFVVTDPGLCRALISDENRTRGIFDAGRRISLTPEQITVSR